MIIPDGSALPWMVREGAGAGEKRWFESRDDEDGSGDGTSSVSKTILEWLFLAIAIFLLCSIFFRRMMMMKRANQPMSQFFRAQPQWSSPPRPSRVVPCSQPCPRDMAYIAPLPSAHPRPRRAHRRTRGANTDGRGRRLDSGENDYGSIDEKDVLPAYDNVGGPPEYDDVAAPPPVARALPQPDDPAQLPRSASAEDIVVQPRSPPHEESVAPTHLLAAAPEPVSVDATSGHLTVSTSPALTRQPSVDSTPSDVPSEVVPPCPPAPPPSPDRSTTT
ncbi:uncharacterized protein SCHCODRAFT_02638148 [Schizophyllum commune H4-8]|uniref:Uncharacterized protein n=1 Tax=Schizophyllum commune (strain H4-8 / FGSC 9210) TaxID=578458 RepID=D8QF18_SCHCM|nr:uncharacterized protein SCHCODRAFT_02638148 [Schizophyllum commune H4-8]KAI5887446.1 hypothetical protein SCHCODRAFT_02638148 [Schizophyllum commune H4-8]